jgi:pimeloyl-ACP methyl ester carboxylesterase
MDALKIDKAIVAGFDWGARTADIMAALWPERCKALVSVSGYLIGNQAPLPPGGELQWWYQFYFATERGREGYGTIFRSLSGTSVRRSGTLMTPPSTAVRRRSTTRIMSPS